MKRIRVVLADDHPVIRGYIKRALQRDPDIAIIGEASDGEQVIDLVCELEPDVVLLDVEMPGLNGVDATHKLHDEGLDIPILMISSHNDANLILALFQIGVAGYIIKDQAPTQVVPAVRAVARGQTGWLSQDLVETMPEPARKELFELQDLEHLFARRDPAHMMEGEQRR